MSRDLEMLSGATASQETEKLTDVEESYEDSMEEAMEQFRRNIRKELSESHEPHISAINYPSLKPEQRELVVKFLCELCYVYDGDNLVENCFTEDNSQNLARFTTILNLVAATKLNPKAIIEEQDLQEIIQITSQGNLRTLANDLSRIQKRKLDESKIKGNKNFTSTARTFALKYLKLGKKRSAGEAADSPEKEEKRPRLARQETPMPSSKPQTHSSRSLEKQRVGQSTSPNRS